MVWTQENTIVITLIEYYNNNSYIALYHVNIYELAVLTTLIHTDTH